MIKIFVAPRNTMLPNKKQKERYILI